MLIQLDDFTGTSSATVNYVLVICDVRFWFDESILEFIILLH
jgi:hypothetical protein